MVRSMKVAVIGAGIAGLVSARELQREGHQVTVFERTGRIGGIWAYDPRVESDPLGLDPNREIVHSSVYKSLRINVPRQLMGFLDYPFERKEGGDARSFPGHEELLRYIEDFARDFGLNGLIRFGHQVTRVEPVDEAGDEWVVWWKTKGTEVVLKGEEIFQAVVVCNGKYTEPKIADFPGSIQVLLADGIGRDTWPRIQMHSHNYRTPEPFENKIVVVIGNGASAREILSEIGDVAKEVHQAMRPPKLEVIKWDKTEIKWHQHPMIEYAQEDGTVVFQDKSFVCADAIIHCTGYHFHFPFLKTKGRVIVDENRVEPLYKHVFPPSLAPGLSFVGLPQLVVPSVVSELQAKWIARVLSGKVNLPTREEMQSSVEDFYRQLEKDGIPKQDMHKLRQKECEYENWLIAQTKEQRLEKWKEHMMPFAEFVKIVSTFGSQYRDTWDVDKSIQEFENSEHTSLLRGFTTEQ